MEQGETEEKPKDSHTEQNEYPGGTPSVTAPVANISLRKIRLMKDGKSKYHTGKRVKTKENSLRGHCIGSNKNSESGKVHILDSIRAQAIYEGNIKKGINEENIRYKTYVSRSSTLTVFLVDTSGSMLARQQAEMAKGCVMALLKDAYVNRDQVAMITFGGEKAETVLPPTSSLEIASALLKQVRTGGKTPMLDGLDKAKHLTEKIQDKPILFVIISDGKYSRMGNKDPERVFSGFGEYVHRKNGEILFVDTEKPSVFSLGDGKRITEIMNGNYIHLNELREDKILEAIEQNRK